MAVLNIIAGPAKGKTFKLQRDSKFLIGRDSSGELYLADDEVSRLHAEIFRRDNIFYIKDLKSTNGTMVNGIPITTETLKDKDRIKIGTSVLVFTLEEPIANQELKIRFQTGKEFGTSNVDIKLEPDQEMPENVQPEAVGKEVTSPSITTLYRISKMIASEKNPVTLFNKVLKLIVETIKADQGYILIWEKGNDKITAPMMYPEEKKQLRISRTIIKRVIQYIRPLLTADAMVDPGLRESDSAFMFDIKSVICVPMTSIPQGQVVLYLESNKLDQSFTQADLELATTIALQVSMVLAKIPASELLEWLVQEERKLAK